jgi:hypothetical protein
VSLVTERELFTAYRGGDGRYYADCACGGTIVAASGAVSVVDAAVTAHQQDPVHVQWRDWQEAVNALKRPARHKCPCCGGDFS